MLVWSKALEHRLLQQGWKAGSQGDWLPQNGKPWPFLPRRERWVPSLCWDVWRAAPNNRLPAPPAQCLLIKGSSSRKMGGSLLRKMSQQPQGEKEEDLRGGIGRSSNQGAKRRCYQCSVSLPCPRGRRRRWREPGWLRCPPCKDSQWDMLQRHSESTIAAPEGLPKPRAIPSSSWSQSPEWKAAAAWFS